MLKDYLPVFHVLEPQMLKGIYAGAIIAQRPVKYTAIGDVYGVATVTKGAVKFIENGVVMTLDVDGNLVNYATTKGGPKMIHFTEELPTVLKAKDTWALKCTEGDTYPRGIVLQVGDEFVTDNVSGAITAAGYATVVDGILTVSTDSTNAEFAAYPDTLPDGTDAYHFIVLK
jgi:hypothetical protein